MHPNNLTSAAIAEEFVCLDDPESGLSGVIVLNSTRLGPAAGGCRFWRYETAAEVAYDAMRLAEGMSYKNALADLPFGGGKAVLRVPDGNFDRTRLFQAFGRAVARLEGRYVTAEDVGTSVEDMMSVATATRPVAGLPPKAGMPGGDPSPWTARGVFRSMEVSARHKMDAEISDMVVAVQGLGNVGFALCEMLWQAGARLIVAEPRPELAALAAERFGVRVMTSQDLFKAKADMLAPCALGGVIDENVVAGLQVKIICGAANNQLASPDQAGELAARDILYAPDYLVNAGGIINVAAEHFGWAAEEAHARVELIGDRLAMVLNAAESSNVPPDEAARQLARSLIEGKRHAAKTPAAAGWSEPSFAKAG